MILILKKQLLRMRIKKKRASDGGNRRPGVK